MTTCARCGEILIDPRTLPYYRDGKGELVQNCPDCRTQEESQRLQRLARFLTEF